MLSQAVTLFSNPCSNSKPSQETAAYDPLLEIFLACILNGGICLYQISKERVKTLSYSQILKLTFKVTNPLIPAFSFILTAALIGTLALRLLKKQCHIWLKTCVVLARLSLINSLALTHFTLLVHELGHAVLAKAFFKTPRVSIVIYPFLGGKTTYAVSYGLTKIGEVFGKDRALLLIVAGGFMASIITSLSLTHFSKLIKQSNPFSSKLLYNLALSQISIELIHCIASLNEKEPDYQNDFTYLMHAGSIHPLIPTSLMIASCFYSIYSVQSLL